MKNVASPTLKTFGFGGCNFANTSPQLDKLSSSTVILNITVSFEDALKLSLAIDECVRRLNSYNRARSEGKRSALNLAIHLTKSRLTVNATKL